MYLITSLLQAQKDGQGPVRSVFDLLSGSMVLADRMDLIAASTAYVDALLAENAALKATGAVVPDVNTVTKRQLKLWLHSQGLLVAVEQTLAGIPDENQRIAAQIEWTEATVFERSHSLVAMLGAAIGLTPEQIDTAFAEAALL